jgi:subtilisin-like proprotein convertase family protein
MQPNFTLKKVGYFTKLSPILLALCLMFAATSNAQTFSNGPLSTGATNSVGTAAPAGTTWSELQTGATTFGYSASTTAGFSVADDFTISCGTWNVTKLTFYGYSTGYTGTTSPFTDLRVAIYNTNPTVGNPAPIFGDRTTNRLTASSFSNMYRINTGASDVQRKIWAIEATIPSLTLTSGTYWVEWSMGAGALTNFAPPVTVVGTLTQPGWNAQQRAAATGVWTALVDGASPQAMPFDLTYTSTACTGTPNPGNTIASVATVCPGIPVNLSFQNCTAGSGVTYQWQQASAVGGPYSNVPTGGTGSTYSTTLTATTFYRVLVTCGANTGTSVPVQVALTPPSGCYCTAGSPDVTFEKISNVTFNTINNNSTGQVPYSNFTNLSTTVIKGQTLPISVSISGGFTTDQVAVWIDFNQNGSFTDAGELVLRTVQGAGPLTGNITISPTANTGSTRMRVRMYDAAFNPGAGPCGNTAYGEVEDYTVDIQPCVNASITAQPTNVSAQCSSNATFSFTTTGSAPVYAWEYRTSATGFWQPVNNTAPFSGATTNSLTLTNVSNTMNGWQVRGLVSNPCTGIDFTNTVTLTVVPLVAGVTPTSATICAGTIQQISLTNAAFPTTQTFNATGLPLAIPDANATGISSTIPVTLPAGSVIQNVAVRLSIPAHTWPGDLVIALRAPNGKVINLDYAISNTGYGPGAGMTNTVIGSAFTKLLSSATSPFTDNFKADAQMTPTANGNNGPVAPTTFNITGTNLTNLWSALYTTPSGNWTLGVYDAWGGDTGSLTAWSLDITYGAPAAGVWTAAPAAPNTMFTDAAATVPYVAGTPVNTIYVKPAVSTSYTVVYSTSTPCVSGPTVIPVTVINPTGTVTQPVATAACVGKNATFTVSATGGPNTIQWQESTNNGLTWTNIAGATSGTLTLNTVTPTMNNNLYRAVLSAAPCAGTVTSNSAKLTVNNLPTVTLSTPDANITPGQTTTLNVTSNPAAVANGYLWTLNGVTIPGSTNVSSQTVNINGFGSYQARVTDANGCINTSNTVVIGAEASDRLWIYPNPSTGQFQVRLYYGGTITEDRRVSIYDSRGELVMWKEFSLTNSVSPYLQMDFDLSKFADGTYVVKVHNRRTNQITSGLVVKAKD